jgi:hypothetical protein
MKYNIAQMMPKLNVIKKLMVERVNTMLSISAGYIPEKDIHAIAIDLFYSLSLWNLKKKIKIEIDATYVREDQEEKIY